MAITTKHEQFKILNHMDLIDYEKALNVPRVDSPKNWIEDYENENGNYICRCCRCKEYFFGHKRRVLCAECANQLVDDAL